MDPTTFASTFTGMVIVAIIFAPLILAVIAVLAIILAVVNRRHRERMKMIEQGMILPTPRPKKGNYYGLLTTGAIFFAFGLALFAGKLAERGNDFTGGFIFGFIGLALLACFAIVRLARKSEPAGRPEGGPPAPPPLPPQP
jgi:hypothetical protein